MNFYKNILVTLATLVGALSFSGAAMAQSGVVQTYSGPHPIPQSHGGGWDNNEYRHIHNYEPDDYYLYSQYNDDLYFIGDPLDFGWRGVTYKYWGHHRIDLLQGGTVITVGYCYIPGPHYHVFSPPAEVISYYNVYIYAGSNYYYWNTDLWTYPSYSRYYDNYYNYWNVIYPRYYPSAPNRQKYIGRGPKNNSSGYPTSSDRFNNNGTYRGNGSSSEYNNRDDYRRSRASDNSNYPTRTPTGRPNSSSYRPNDSRPSEVRRNSGYPSRSDSSSPNSSGYKSSGYKSSPNSSGSKSSGYKSSDSKGGSNKSGGYNTGKR